MRIPGLVSGWSSCAAYGNSSCSSSSPLDDGVVGSTVEPKLDGQHLDDAGEAAELLCKLLFGGYQRFTCLGFEDCGVGEAVKGVDHAVAHIIVCLVLLSGLVCHSVVGDAGKGDDFTLGLEPAFPVLLTCRLICGFGGV